MSSAFNEGNGPQPPKLLKTPAEIVATLRLLLQHHDPLLIQFHERSQRFQSYVVDIDRERSRIALDEIIPTDGERFFKQGESFSVEAFRDGVRVAWKCEHSVQIGQHDGAPCYWTPLPAEMIYHQRRSAFRAALKQTDLIKVVLSSDKLHEPLTGHLLDISATGCKLRFAGDQSQQLQNGQVHERLTAQLPFGAMTTAVELRHVQYEAKIDCTFVGTRFFDLGGLEQRNVERFVYQLQREARRTESD
ncbi:Flagellar brake protein YcgR [Pseudomonas sp. 8Z]|uniref:flagellar brake protein n=1 Tax=Pseudomonas sp. 8Z TaxID=2653166 RepID=UPI0012F27F4D|nr:flagellar brake protein [Pseudomonas sp. 8Z]VXC31216.1 Flagellar brake protein YcgR [Pseudomonas sp. 8Z]